MPKLIIADDEMRVCQLIARLVPWEEYGIKIAGVAYNGPDAYDLICKLKPDIVITDIRMPGFDGLELIRKTKEYDEHISFIIVSGHRDFEYAQNAIKYGAEDYILKPIAKEELISIINKIINKRLDNEFKRNNEIILKNELEKSKEVIRGQFGMKLIQSGGDPDLDDMEAVNQEFSFSFRRGEYQALIFKLDNIQSDRTDKGYAENILEKLLEVIRKKNKEFCIESIEVIYGLRIAVFLNYIGTQEQIKREFMDAFEKAKTLVASYGNYYITMSTGSIENALNNLKLSYQNAVLTDRFRIIKGTNKIIYYQNRKTDYVKHDYALMDLEKALLNSVELFNIDDIIDKITAFVDRCVPDCIETPNEIFDLCEKIIDFIVSSVEKAGFSQQNSQTFKQDLLESLDNAMTIDEIKKILTGNLRSYLDKINETRKMQDYKPIRIAKQYISERYMEPISLEDIAALVELNPVYFSVMFKKETGINFKDYLINYRIEAAKELLKTTNNSIQMISGMVGYSDSKYFSKLFNKIVGIKPNKYKKIYG